MMETVEQTEDRIARTLAAVAAQTEPEANQPPVAGDVGSNVVSLDIERKPRTMVFAAAAAAVAVVGIGFAAVVANSNRTVDTAATGTDSDVSTPTTVAPEPDVTVIELNGEPAADGQPLRLILPEGYLPAVGAEVGIGGPGTIAEDGSAIVVGRSTQVGIDEPVAIYLTKNTGGFSVEDGSETEVAGRTILNSFDEGLVEQVDGQRWIIYQTEFDDPKLEQIVAGTSVEEDRLVFTSVDPFEELARQESVDLASATTVFSEVSSGDRVLTVGLQTVSASGAELALLSSLAWWSSGVERIEIDGRPAYLSTMDVPAEEAADEMGTFTVIGWQPSDFHTAAILIGGATTDEAIAIVEGMSSVDAASWDAYWS